RDRVPAYASGALLRPHPVDYLAKAGPRLRDMGFKQMKMQCGSEPSVAASIERVRIVRDAIGTDVDLMCDINQLWSVNHAIEVGRRIEPYHLYWLEDPVAHDDYAGLARVADALTTPIAAGEYHYGVVSFRHMLEARSIDVVMIDLLRVGGITQWMKVAGMAEAFNLPVVSHLVPEIHVHLVAAIPNGLTVEYMPWTLGLFAETPALDGGQLVVPKRPGLGLANSGRGNEGCRRLHEHESLDELLTQLRQSHARLVRAAGSASDLDKPCFQRATGELMTGRQRLELLARHWAEHVQELQGAATAH